MTNLDLAAIRRSAERGDPQLPATVVALCDHIKQLNWELDGAVACSRLREITHEELLTAARAYFAAVGSGDGIVAAEQALREAVEECGS